MPNEISLFGSSEENKELEELKKTIYSTKIQVPKYIPSEVCPSLTECVDTLKYEDLLKEINNSNVSQEEKTFLKLAATRHICFTYNKIADYYAHSSKEMQSLMEKSALVILDVNNAISDGYIQLSTKLESLIGGEVSE